MILAFVCAVSRLVPAAERAEWLAEWRAELAYVRETRGLRAAARLSMGAVPDALWLRREAAAAVRLSFLDSPARTLALLTALATIAVSLAPRAPLVRMPRGLASISTDGRAWPSHPTVPFGQYQTLALHRPSSLAGIAFYTPPRRLASLEIAVATPDLFALLGVPAPRPRGPALLLGDSAWRRRFHADPRIAGRVLQIDGRSVPIAGVLPPGAWPLPRAAEAWLLEEAPPVAPETRGFVIARMPAAATGADLWRIYAPSPIPGAKYLECIRIAPPHPGLEHLLAIALALIVVRAMTQLTLGQYPSGRPSMRFWLFFAAKLALLGVTVSSTVLWLGPLQAHILIAGYIASLRWAVVDQRGRCPVCLRRLTNPSPIGCASYTFLDWYGTELICRKGHGLLHIPEIPASSYGGQRWSPLDPSWSSLFS
jgi:hypothetical protein